MVGVVGSSPIAPTKIKGIKGLQPERSSIASRSWFGAIDKLQDSCPGQWRFMGFTDKPPNATSEASSIKSRILQVRHFLLRQCKVAYEKSPALNGGSQV